MECKICNGPVVRSRLVVKSWTHVNPIADISHRAVPKAFVVEREKVSA